MHKYKNDKKLLAVALSLLVSQAFAMTEMENSELDGVVGQALFVADKISGTVGGVTPYDDFTFYRVGLDVELGINANINKLQLGCGGVNDALVAGCDVDIDFFSFMGRSGSLQGAAATSSFVLTRPYFEFAIKNDNIASQREIVGYKIGAQTADGIMAAGRTYTAGQTNLENGGTCGTGSAAARVACHSGINQISGNLGFEMSGYTHVNASVIPIIAEGEADACFGHVSSGPAGAQAACGAGNAFYANQAGTRMSDVLITNVPLTLYNGSGILFFFTSATADIRESLRMTHQIALTNASNFGMSSQRERVLWPRYDRTFTTDAATIARETANTGWWFNLPEMKILNAPAEDQSLSGGDALNALIEGVNLENLDLGIPAVDNCFGTLKFC